MNDFDLNIVVPCYNEEKALIHFYNELKSVLVEYTNAKIVFVDDGSKDKTLSVIKTLSDIDESVYYITLSKNFGQQAALKAGFDVSVHADCVICMDADLQHPPTVIPDLVAKWKQGYDVVNTLRHDSHGTSQGYRFLRSCFYTLINRLSKHKIIRNGPDYRLLDKKVIAVLRDISEEGLYIKELISWVGFRHSYVPFKVDERIHGKSSYSLLTLIKLSAMGITSFSINPLRLSTILGLITSLFAFIYGFYALYMKVFTNYTVTGWTSIIVSILFVSGIQFILIGIIGEYLGRTYIESKKRPLYVINETNWYSNLTNRRKLTANND